MKKILYLLITILVISLFTACSTEEDTDTTDDISISDTTTSSSQDSSDSTSTESSESSESTESTESTDTEDNGIDVDLTQLSSTMLYAEVFSMVSYPDEYLGKIVRMQGDVATYTDPDTGDVYYAIIIADATACCAQGIEFLLTDEYEYPDVGSVVTIQGEFETYVETKAYDITYCRLKDASMIVE